MLSRKQEMHLVQQLINFAQEKCEEQQVVSGCAVDEDCGPCPILIAQKTGVRLLGSMIEWDAHKKRPKSQDANRTAKDHQQQKEGFFYA